MLNANILIRKFLRFFLRAIQHARKVLSEIYLPKRKVPRDFCKHLYCLSGFFFKRGYIDAKFFKYHGYRTLFLAYQRKKKMDRIQLLLYSLARNFLGTAHCFLGLCGEFVYIHKRGGSAQLARVLTLL